MRIKTIIFFSIFGLCICPSYAADIYDKFNEANMLILSEQFPKAKKILNEIHKKNPKNLQITNNLAYIEAKLGNIDGAIKILRDSISNDKHIDVIYKNLTNLYAFQANILYEEALSIKESNNEVSLSLAQNLKTNNLRNINKNENNNKTMHKRKINPDDIKSFIKEDPSTSVVMHGHTHRYRNEKIGNTLVINPGESAGMLKGKNSIGLIRLADLKFERIFF